MGYGKSVRLLTAAAAIALMASGCSVWKSKSGKEAIDPPPESAETMMMGTGGAAGGAQAANAKSTQVTIYAKDAHGYVAPLSVPVGSTQSVAKTALSYMVEDGEGKGVLPKGFTALLPKGTQVGVNIADKLATVDFSKEFLQYNPQDERKIIEAVTWTLTGFPSVERVQIRVQGKDLKEMPETGLPLNGALTRAMGINLSLTPNVDPGQSTAVTVYFENQTADHFAYYVPVTRMVKRTDQLAQAAMTELLKGPDQMKGLLPAFNAEAAVLGIKQSDDKSTVTVDMNSKFLDAESKASPEALQAVVLSLIENTGAAKVQVTVNGSEKFTVSGGASYSQPVAKPVHVNPVAM